MLDIDLEFLKFLLNPNYEYLKKDLEIIKNSYLEDVKEELKPELADRLNTIDFLFLTKVSSLGNFLCKLVDLLTTNIYIEFGKLFSLNLETDIAKNNTNFITNILINNNINYLYDDDNLKILNTKIKTYLTNITLTAPNSSNYKVLAQKAINYIDEATKKYKEITKILTPYFKLAYEQTEKQQDTLEILLKEIIKENASLLSESAQKIIQETDDYDIEEFLKDETKFNKFFIFNTTDAVWRMTDFVTIGNIVNINNLDNYQEIIIELQEKINKYNKLIKKELEENEFTIPKSQIQKIFIDKLRSLNETEENIKIISEHIVEFIYNENSNFFQTYSRSIILEPLTSLNLDPLTILNKTNNNFKISNAFYRTLSHELYHVFDLPLNIFNLSKNPKKQFPILFDNKFELLYKTYTDYRAITKICKLIQEGNFNKEGFISYIYHAEYNSLFFMLIDFFEEYTKEFDECIASNSIAPLIKILGKKEFKHLLKIINKFNEESFNSDLRYATSIIKTTDKYQKRAKTREKVRKIFK